jgi:hypothetical protein
MRCAFRKSVVAASVAVTLAGCSTFGTTMISTRGRFDMQTYMWMRVAEPGSNTRRA